MLVLVSGALAMVAHAPAAALDVRADSAPLRTSGPAGPALSISTANLSGDTRVALFAEWGPSACALASGWYRWSLAEPTSVAFLEGSGSATALLLGMGNASGFVTVELEGAATVDCGNVSFPVLGQANVTVFVAAPLLVGPVLVPSLAAPGAAISLTTDLTGVPPFHVAVAWGDGSATVTSIATPGPLSLAHEYPAGSFRPSLVVQDGEHRTALANASASIEVTNASAIALSTPQPEGEVGVAVPFQVETQDLPAGAQFVDLCGLLSTGSFSTSLNFSCEFRTPGLYTVQVLVTDAVVDVPIASFEETIDPPARIALAATDLTADPGRSLELVATLSGGVPPFTVGLSGPGLGSLANASFPCDGVVALAFSPPTSGPANLSVTLGDALLGDAETVAEAVQSALPLQLATFAANSTSPGGTSVQVWGEISGGVPPYAVLVWPTAATTNVSSDAWSVGANLFVSWNASFAAEGTASVRTEVVDGFGVSANSTVGVPLVPLLEIAGDVFGESAAPGNATNATVTVVIAGGRAPFELSLSASTGASANLSAPDDGSVEWNLSAPDVGPVQISISVTDALAVERTLQLEFSAEPPPAPGAGPTPNGTGSNAASTAPSSSDGLWAAVGLVAIGAAAAVIWTLRRRRRRNQDAPAGPDPVVVLRDLIAPADGADRGTIELLAEEAGVPMETVTSTLDRLIADGRIRSERSDEGEESLTWFGEPAR